MKPWLVAGIVLSVVATILTWTALRPHLSITDGAPTATDPFTPFGVSLVNAILVALSWALVAIATWAVRALRGRAHGADSHVDSGPQ